jgi:hypothetical protein
VISDAATPFGAQRGPASQEEQMNDVESSTATVPTDRPGRYGKQLVSHMSRRGHGEWDEATESGTLDLRGGHVTLETTADALVLRLTVAPDDDVARLEDVVGRHLVRFGARDELVVAWQRSDGTAGTVQRKTEA